MSFSSLPAFSALGSRLRLVVAAGLVLLSGLGALAERPTEGFVRSTVLMAKHKGEFRTVVAVKGEKPQVMVGDKLEGLPDDVGFLPFRGKRSVDAYVDVLDQEARAYQVNQIIRFENGGEVDNGPISRGSAYECNLLANKRVEDCYLVLIFINRDFLSGSTNELKCNVVFRNVGTLEPGKKKKEYLSFNWMDEEKRRQTIYCPMLFSHGIEVKTAMSFRSDQILARIETLQHASLVSAYIEKNKDQDHKLRMYQQSAMSMPEGTDLAALPESVSAMFTVDAEGKVQAVQIKGVLPPKVKRALVANIESWLFLPALEKGRPKPTAVQVPIRLREPAAPPAGS
jgi:hypothetical protein